MSAAALKDSDPVVPRRSNYAQRKSERRLDARERIHVRVVHPISTPQLLRDPLAHKTSPLRSTITTTRVLLLALVVHGAVLFVFLVLNRFLGTTPSLPERTSLRVQIRDVEPPPPAPPVKDEEVEGPVADDFEEPDAGVEEPVEVKSPVPAPIEDAAVEEVQEVEAPVRRIIGLSLESTVEGGSGPAFATGTSRMGRTESVAEDPKIAVQKPRVAAEAPSGSRPGTREQRVATRIPTAGGVFVNPQRKTPIKPAFPPTLRARGVEGDVRVRVKISPSGTITEVTILQSSGHPEFDKAAYDAALSERFSPATRDGKPIADTLTYSYRFRIED